MDKHVQKIPVYPIRQFGATQDFFWMETLESGIETHTWWQNPHQQAYFMLLYLEDAQGSIIMDGQHIAISAQMVVCCKPNAVNSIKLTQGTKGWLLAFSADFFSLRFNSNVLQQYRHVASREGELLCLSEIEQSKWMQLGELMLHEFQQAKPAYTVLRSYLNILLHATEAAIQANKPNSDRPQRRHEKVIQFQELLDQHFLESRSPSFYADKLNISLHYLNKLCKMDCQTTSGQLIRNRVMTEVKRMLKHTSFSIAEIAYQLGFESPSYFNTFFKKHVGFTPESFRHTE